MTDDEIRILMQDQDSKPDPEDVAEVQEVSYGDC